MDSMDLKLDAYCHALSDYGFAREALREIQLASAGLSRHQVLPLMVESLAGKALSDSEFKKVLQRFHEKDEALRPQMRPKPGAMEFLRCARDRGLPLSVVTGTPQEVIDATVRHFDLGRFFQKVCGTPGSKSGYLRRLPHESGISPGEAVYVGDAVLDEAAAQDAGMPFIGLDNGDHPFREQSQILIIERLSDLIPVFRLVAAPS